MLSELWSDFLYRVRTLFRRRRVERELDDELRFHVERETEKHVRAGIPHAEAVRRARLAFGGIDRIKDDTRDAHGVALLDVVTHDLRYAVRGLRLTPGFTIAIVLTLALGIGANAAMFGVIDRLMFRPPAFLRDPQSVNRVYLSSIFRKAPLVAHTFEYKRYLDFTGWTTSFDQTAAFALRSTAVGTGQDAREMTIGIATVSFFDFFDAHPEAGRFFTAQEDTPSPASLVTVISHAFWQTQFGGRRDAIGSRLQIGPMVFTIIGVAPEGFAGVAVSAPPIAWIPLTPFAASHRGYNTNYNWGWLEMLVRRKPAASVASSTADLTAAYQRSWLAERAIDASVTPVDVAHPAVLLGPTQFERGPEAGPAGRVATWVSGVAFVALLVACANVANLLLARAFRRRREIAVRLAMGISRGRLLAQLTTESLLLAVLGGCAGLLVGRWAGALLERMFDPTNATTPAVADPRTILFCAGVTLFVGLLTGLAPALHAGRGDLITALKTGVREGSYARSRLRTVLVILQGALSVVLLVGAGLFVRSLVNVHSMRLGYDVDPILVVQRNMRGVTLTSDESRALQQRLLEVAESTPGVASATQMISTPFYSFESMGLYVPGVDSVHRLGRFQLQLASPSYFRTVGTRILAGRGINAEDRQDAPRVVVVSQEMARRLWPDRSALGQCIRIGEDTTPCSTVVGIAENIKERDLSHTAEANYYVSADQVKRDVIGLYVRMRGDARSQSDVVRRQLQTAMPGASYITVTPFADIIGTEQRSWTFGATMFAALGALALVLAAIGLYSVIAYGVAQRTHELGVRIALGAQVRDLLGIVIGEGLRLAVAGLAIGGVLAFFATRGIASLLFDESPHDPVVYAIVAGVLLAAALVASVVPAVRAARVDPNIALRADG